jgi:hypothetical protein
MIILEQAKSLLDFNQKLDIGVLDRVVHLMYTEHGDTVSVSFGSCVRLLHPTDNVLF